MDECGNKHTPLISVIMGVYNCEKTVEEAIRCIMEQSVSDWELIVCDDGSLDETYHLVESICRRYPGKIVLLKNEGNKGLNYTLNRCLRHARGKYIARMDGDDLCTKDRFERELSVLENEPGIFIVSSDMEFFDETGVWGRISHPEYPSAYDFLAGTPFCHAPCMVRRVAYEAVGGYTDEPRLIRVEDYHLWIKMYERGYRGKNIHEPLYQMRDDRAAYKRRGFRYRLNEAYVKTVAVKTLHLPIYGYVSALRPILVGLLPPALYDFLHKKNLQKR